jgi:hypothetical protein
MAASHRRGIGTHWRHVNAVSAIPVTRRSVAADRVVVGSASHQTRTAAMVSADETTHREIVCTDPAASADAATAAASIQRALVIHVEADLSSPPCERIARPVGYLAA